MRLGYSIVMLRSWPFLCDQAIPQLLREVAYFCAIRLSHSYLERLPISVRLGYPIATQRGCLFLCDKAILQLLREVTYLCAIRLSYQICLFSMRIGSTPSWTYIVKLCFEFRLHNLGFCPDRLLSGTAPWSWSTPPQIGEFTLLKQCNVLYITVSYA